MSDQHPILNYLLSEDPLCGNAIKFLLGYKEEDDLVDFKLTLDPCSEKEWIEIVKDVTAFSNTFGGYLVFGVKNHDKSIVGLSDEHSIHLSEINNIHQKINRFIEPHIGNLRSKEYIHDGKKIIVINIPRAKGITHIVSKDAAFNQQSGKPKVLLHKGTFYVRRSARNQLADARDLDSLIERRIDQFKDVLLNRICQVIDASKDSDVYILSKDVNDPENKRFIIESSPDSIPIQGMSFSVAPEEGEEKVAAWTVISSGNSQIVPPLGELWEWYRNRLELEISEKQRLAVAQFCMWSEVPPFYWLRGIRAQVIQTLVLDTINHRRPGATVKATMVVASFLGKSFYKKALIALGEYQSRLSQAMQSYPDTEPQIAHCKLSPKANQSHSEFIIELGKKMEEIVLSVDISKNNDQPSAIDRMTALEIDIYLYAQNDKYA